MDYHDDETALRRLLQPPCPWPEYSAYKPLDRDHQEIRLLHVQLDPSTLRIHGHLEHASLQSPPSYEALSYYWGPPDFVKAISLDGEEVFIRHSLHQCLVALCLQGQGNPLWLDAICINERDVEERSWQVSMMSDIYRSAEIVKAWIGEPNADTDYLFDFIKLESNRDLRTSAEYSDIRRRARSSYLQVMHRPYWKRAWVVQEIALARKVTVVCGARVVAWDQILRFDHELRANARRPQKDRYLQDADDPSKQNSPLQVIEDARQALGREVSKEVLLVVDPIYDFLRCEAEDPKDKFYAFYGIATLRHQLEVDYRKPITDLYWDIWADLLHAINAGSKLPSEHGFAEFTDKAIRVMCTLPCTKESSRNLFEDADTDDLRHTIRKPVKPKYDMFGTYTRSYNTIFNRYRSETRVSSLHFLIQLDQSGQPSLAAIAETTPNELYKFRRASLFEGDMQLCNKMQIDDKGNIELAVHYSRAAILSYLGSTPSLSGRERVARAWSDFVYSKGLWPRLCHCDPGPSEHRERVRELLVIEAEEQRTTQEYKRTFGLRAFTQQHDSRPAYNKTTLEVEQEPGLPPRALATDSTGQYLHPASLWRPSRGSHSKAKVGGVGRGYVLRTCSLLFN